MSDHEEDYGVDEAPMIPAPRDNWAHRSQNMRCASCMWFVQKAGGAGLGRCRRHAPTMSGFPAVFGTDWCGDHKLDEKRL
jgi:hypothetical protein